MKKGKNQARNSRGQFIKSAPPSSLATPAPSSSRISQPSTPAAHSSTLVSSSHVSSPSDLPGSYPSSQLASPALGSSLVDTPSRPASPDGPSFYFPTPPVSTAHSQPVPSSLDPANSFPQSTPDPPDAAALSAPPSSSSIPSASVALPTAIVISPAPVAPSITQPAPSTTNAQQSTTVPTPAIAPRSQSIMTSLATGPGAMPAPRSNNAPYFSGEPGDPLAEFLHEYDGLASSLGLTSAQKVDTIFRYVPASVREFWETLDGYPSRDWTAFRAALEGIYPDTTAGNRYTKTGLQEFVKISARTRIQDEDDLILYHRRFLQISNPLRLSQSLSDEEQNAEFFNGFHPKDRDILYDRLYTLNPK